MDGINHIVISGNVTKDAELKETDSGVSILRYSVAVNESRRNKSTEEYESYTNYFDCVMFGGRAKAVSKLLKKGTRVCVAGKLHHSRWEAEDGNKRSRVEVVASDIEIQTVKQNKEENESPEEFIPF